LMMMTVFLTFLLPGNFIMMTVFAKGQV